MIDDSHRLARARAAITLALRHLSEALDSFGARVDHEKDVATITKAEGRHLYEALGALLRGAEQLRATERGTLEECERTMRDVARNVENRLPPGWRFLVLACTLDSPGFTSYVANVNRADACALLTEWLAKIRLERPEA